MPFNILTSQIFIIKFQQLIELIIVCFGHITINLINYLNPDVSNVGDDDDGRNLLS